LQWAILLGRFEIQLAAITMSCFPTGPKKGHLKLLKRLYGYLQRFKNENIRVHIEEPDFSSLPAQDFYQLDTLYGKVQEEIANYAPATLRKHLVLVSYVDANLYHDM
jgi:hypothetical protein